MSWEILAEHWGPTVVLTVQSECSLSQTQSWSQECGSECRTSVTLHQRMWGIIIGSSGYFTHLKHYEIWEMSHPNIAEIFKLFNLTFNGFIFSVECSVASWPLSLHKTRQRPFSTHGDFQNAIPGKLHKKWEIIFSLLNNDTTLKTLSCHENQFEHVHSSTFTAILFWWGYKNNNYRTVVSEYTCSSC